MTFEATSLGGAGLEVGHARRLATSAQSDVVASILVTESAD